MTDYVSLQDVTKTYRMGEITIKAADGISFDVQKGEFVIVVGPSGAGKTTVLNILGGMDVATSGKVFVDGAEITKYRGKKLIQYRREEIGFVFQFYNLMQNLTALENVELAMQICKYPLDAKKVLEEVGLKERMNNFPAQLSGGEQQRVAIARALAKNPKLLLCDEPTGALDSETSVQIMELLKEISKDKLIIMVTHNPELAEKYSNRIIRLLDGKVVDDTNPYDRNIVEPIENKKGKEKKAKKPSMSYLTALSLSLNNLMTKKGRTFMTSFAGSIGIIGIALILSISSGAQLYIKSVEEETLASYPISISRNSMDMTSMMTSMMKENKSDGTDDGKIHSNNIMGNMVNSMLTQLKSNDLKSFKSYLENDEGLVRGLF